MNASLPSRRLPRLTARRLQSITGSIIGIFVIMHLANHALGLISVEAQESFRPWAMGFWHTWLGQLLLYGSLLVHAALGLSALAGKRHFRLPLWEFVQILLGLMIPYLLLGHIISTRGARSLAGIDITYPHEIANLWIDPKVRFQQSFLVLLVWGHFVAGLHFWLRIRPWYRRAFPALLLAFVFLPLVSLLGFAEAGVHMAAQARANPEWLRAVKAGAVPADPARARIRTALREWAGPVWLGLLGAVFTAGQIRHWSRRRHRFKVTYPENAKVDAPIGMSILEVSRMAGRPHVSICGGRARCTTCRIRIHGPAGDLPPPGEIEARALARIGAPAAVRLACQLKPAVDVEVQPLLNATLAALDPNRTARTAEFGEERQLTILFIDVRGSTQLAERRLPYDVVFLLNQFFAEMAGAVEETGGHYSNFTGDGLMAIFGLNPSADRGARAAVSCALRMLERLDHMNTRLAGELDAPIAIGIGIHTGEAIVGRMGPPKTPVISALGDSVNTAARLENLTKELHAPVVVSFDTLQAAALAYSTPLQFVMLRGRSTRLAVSALDAGELRELLVS